MVSVVSPGPRPISRAADIRRLLLVTQSVAIGGMETITIDIAAEFVRRGLDVTVIVPEDDEIDPVADRFRSAGARVERLNTDARRGRMAQLGSVPRLIRLAREVRPDVVHLHTGGATGGLGLVSVMRLVTSAGVIVHEHDVPEPHPPLWQLLARRLMDRYVHAVVAVSRRSALVRRERMRTAPPRQRFAVVLGGIPVPEVAAYDRAANRLRVREQFGLAKESVVIGCVVRLASGKGLDDLLRAFALVRDVQPCQLLLVGDGPLRASLELLATDLGIRDRVCFAGFHRDPVPFFHAMDIFALAVPSGSGSIASMEAMAHGLPIVITLSGPEEPVVDGVSGLCAPPHDPRGLASVMERLVGNADLRASLGAAAAKRIRKDFSIQRVADDLLDIYAGARTVGVPRRLSVDEAPPGPPMAPVTVLG